MNPPMRERTFLSSKEDVNGHKRFYSGIGVSEFDMKLYELMRMATFNAAGKSERKTNPAHDAKIRNFGLSHRGTIMLNNV